MKNDLLTWHERGELWLRLGIRVVLLVGALLLLRFVALPVVSLLMPFVLALVMAWLLNPLVRWLKQRLPVSRTVISLVLILLVCGAIGGLCAGLGWALFDQISSLLENREGIMSSVSATTDAVINWVRRLGEMLPEDMVNTEDELLDTITNWIKGLDFSTQVKRLAEWATGFVSAVPGVALATIFFLMASHFITSDYPRMRYMFTEQLPDPLRRFGSQVRTLFVEAFGGYIKSQLLLSLGVFLILTVGFFIIRQPYSLLLAFGLAVMDFIPIIGAGTVMVPWAVVDLIVGDYQGAVSVMVIWGLVVLFRRGAEPKILGNQTGLSPILSLLAIYVGMRVGGVLGMVLGPVLLLVCINLVKLGVFHPVMCDLRRAARDVSAILKGSVQGEPDGTARAESERDEEP